ncbi:unnamed protein product, partial [marine sediment metagenome]
MGIARPIASVGRFVTDQVGDLGKFTVFSGHTFRWIFTDFTRWRLLRAQLYEV